MSTMVFDESYGELTFAQRAAYRKYNVSPYDHTELERKFGSKNHDAITKFVKEHVVNGMYRGLN